MRKIIAMAAFASLAFISCSPGTGTTSTIDLPADAGTITGPTEVEKGASIELSIAEIERAKTYKWYKNNVEVQHKASLTLTVTEAGDYRVAGVNEEGKEGKTSPVHTVSVLLLPDVPAESLALNQPGVTVEVGDELVLKAVVLPENTTDRLIWASNNDGAVTVAEGTLKGIAVGSATVTVKTADGKLSAECLVTVLAPPTISNCREDPADYAQSFGAISFRTDKIWTIGNQQWSDAVVAENARTGYVPGREGENIIFDGGDWWQETPPHFKSDFRAHMTIPKEECGTFFSWPAVVKYRKLLCPDGWRVPISDDFRALNIALGGPDVEIDQEYKSKEMCDKYVKEWGAVPAGACNNFIFTAVNVSALYWTQSEYQKKSPERNAMFIEICPKTEHIGPRYYWEKSWGEQVRCVRNIAVPQN